MTIGESLQKLGQLLKSKMVAHLNSTTKGSGDLARSIEYEVKREDGSYNLIRSMNTYGKYVDGGVRGTNNKKGIPNPKSFYEIGQFKSKVISQQSGLPYPVRYVIARDGIKPNPFILPSMDSVLDKQGMDILQQGGIDEIEMMVGNELKSIQIKN